jgi:hypothetical protein
MSILINKDTKVITQVLLVKLASSIHVCAAITQTVKTVSLQA